jgi:hypothetical protein
MKRATGSALIAVIVAVIIALGPAVAAARSTATLSYAPNEVWAAAVRFLRVDRSLPIREKDEAAGYVLFDYNDGGKGYKAALELIPFSDNEGRVTTQVALTIAGLPRRYEGALLEGLGAKIRDERGSPPAAAAKRPSRGEPAEKERSRDPKDKEKDRERESGKASGLPDAGGLPRIPTLPLQ